MAPRSVQKNESPDEQLLPASEQVTYRPGPEGPLETTWLGHKFQAHVPKTVTNQKLIDMARGNKFFKVGSFDASADVYKEEVLPPKTAEQYRAWAVGWLKDVRNVDELCERWANEARMRAALEVGYDDYHYISSLVQPKLDELIRREGEPRKVRDELIRKNELADLELQILGVGQAA